MRLKRSWNWTESRVSASISVKQVEVSVTSGEYFQNKNNLSNSLHLYLVVL